MDEEGKVLRGQRAMWLKPPAVFENEKWTCLGKDMDDLSIDENPNVEQQENVLGENVTEISSYTPSMSQDYIARKEDSIYEAVQYIVDNLAKDDEHVIFTMLVATLDIQVKDTGTIEAKGKGYEVPVKVVVDSDGGPTTGYTISFSVYESGARVQGGVTVTNKQPTFTAGQTVALSAGTSTKVNTSSSNKSLSD